MPELNRHAIVQEISDKELKHTTLGDDELVALTAKEMWVKLKKSAKIGHTIRIEISTSSISEDAQS